MICRPFLEILVLLTILQYVFTKSCHKDLKLNWLVNIGDSPIVSPPLIATVKTKNKRELIATTFDGSLSVIDIVSGEESPQWPVHFAEEAFFAGPLLYDIDQDGLMDILLTTASGNVMFVSQNGTVMTSFSITLPRLLVKRKWYILEKADLSTEPDLSPEKNTRFITTEDYDKLYFRDLSELFVVLDTHVLSTPVISDFNGDGIKSDLVIPVNYYFDNSVDDQKLKNLTLDKSDINFYQANGLIVVDLRTREIIFNTTFELTMKSSVPCYLFSSPTVVDLDSNHGNSEVLIGSSSGRIHAWNKNGKYPWSFDISDSITGQIMVGDTNSDGHLKVIAVDSSANVMCYGQEKLIWEATVSGTITPGAQLHDIDNDNRLEVVIATNDGYLWVIDAQTGKVSTNWPVALGNEIHSPVLFHKQLDKSVDMVIMSGGNINFVSGSSQCLEVIPVEETSYTPVLYDQNNMAFIISTTDGAILSFHQQGMKNNSVHEDFRVAFTHSAKEALAVTTASFNLEFEISGNIRHSSFSVVLSYSTEMGIKYHTTEYKAPGIYLVTLPSPKIPKYTYILIKLCDRFNQCVQDMLFIDFHKRTKEKLVLFAMLPFLVMLVLLLLIHGYPEGDLLPTWENYRDK